MNQLEQMISNCNMNKYPTLDPQRFQQMVKGIDKNTLIPIIQQARNQGISEKDIEQGLNYLINMR